MVEKNEFEILQEETIPYGYVTDCLALLQQLKARLQSDIYRGILLEVVQRIINDVQVSLMQGENVTSLSLLLAHAHFSFLFKEFLAKDSILASPTGLLRRSRASIELDATTATINGDSPGPDFERIVSLDGQEDDDSEKLMMPARESDQNLHTEERADEDEDEEEAEDEVDIEKTKEGLWSLLTG